MNASYCILIYPVEYIDDFDMAKRATPEEIAEAYNKIRGQSIGQSNGQSKEAAAAKAYQDRLDGMYQWY